MPTTVVNLRNDSYDIYIGRPGKGLDGYFGNPFNGPNRDESIVRFEDYFFSRLKKDPEFRRRVHELKDKILGCFCVPFSCHGSVIAKYVNSIPEVKPIKLAVVGSRSFNDYQFLSNILKWYDISAIISGGARGADALAAQYAKEHNIPLVEFPAEWDKLGKSAGYVRNKKIIAAADEVVAFMDVKNPTPGTTMDIRLAEEARKPVFVYWPVDDPLLEIV